MTTKAIWKFPLKIFDECQVVMPAGAKILSVQAQCDLLVLWAIVDPNEPEMETHAFGIYGTGHSGKDDYGRYIGTVQMEDGLLVLHVFELR